MSRFWSSAQDLYIFSSIFFPIALAISILLYPLKLTYLIHNALVLKNLTSSHIRRKITHTRKIEWPDWRRIWQNHNRFLVALLATISMVTARERNYSWLAIVMCWVMAVRHLRERRLIRRVKALDSELNEIRDGAQGGWGRGSCGRGGEGKGRNGRRTEKEKEGVSKVLSREKNG